MHVMIARPLGALVTLGLLVTGCSSSSDAGESAGDVQAMCAKFAEIEDPSQVDVAYLDELLEVALPEVRPAIQEIRDAVAEDGEAAFEDPEVMARFEEVGSYDAGTCQQDG